MSDSPNDESRLRATEAQMRRALGLQETTPQRPAPAAPGPTPAGQHRPARRFVRDGEVAVSVIHRDDAAGTNLLETTRQALRSQTAAREQAERLLAEAQDAIRDMQTKLAHERMARDEAIQRLVAEKLTTEQALEAARAELLTARAARQEAEQQLQDLIAVQQSRTVNDPPQAPAGRKRREAESAAVDTDVVATPAPAKRRGRPPKVTQPEPDSDIVEWWKPGWKDRYR